jgi:hypothetical protein
MQLDNQKLRFKIKMAAVECLTAFHAIELITSEILQDGRNVDSILKAPTPKLIAAMSYKEISRYYQAKERDDFDKTIFDDPIEYAYRFPEAATREQLKIALIELFMCNKIVLRYPSNLFPVSLIVQSDEDAYLTTKLFFKDFVTFVHALGGSIECTNSEEKSIQTVIVHPQDSKNDVWITIARGLAENFIKVQASKDLYPSQINIGDEVARKMRVEGFFGADGKPLSGATIKRHALKGISSAASKQTSTTIKRSKQGK